MKIKIGWTLNIVAVWSNHSYIHLYCSLINISQKIQWITCKVCSSDNPLHPAHSGSKVEQECNLVLPSVKGAGRGLDQHSIGEESLDRMVLQIYMCCSTEPIYKTKKRLEGGDLR